MFSLARPDDRTIKTFLEEAAASALTYEPVGLSMMSPSGYNLDELRIKIGEGPQDFARAQHAIDAWQPLRVGWVEVHPTERSPAVGADVVVVARHLWFWSLNGCRVVKRFPESAEDRRFGFAYGTLADHAESGEELFVIELDESDGTVWYAIRAVSKPQAVLARLASPVSRRLQERFRIASAGAMAAAVRA